MLRMKIIYRWHPGQKLKEVNAASTKALMAMGKYWHEKFRAKHFTKEGAREYGYKPRDGEAVAGGGISVWRKARNLAYGRRLGRKRVRMVLTYTGRKRKKFGHDLPLVLTGKLRQMTRSATFRATKGRATVKMMGPPYMYKYNKNQKQPDKYRELTTVSPREVRALEAIYREHMTRFMRAPTKFRTKQLA